MYEIYRADTIMETDGRTDWRTGQSESIIAPPHISWWGYKTLVTKKGVSIDILTVCAGYPCVPTTGLKRLFIYNTLSHEVCERECRSHFVAQAVGRTLACSRIMAHVVEQLNAMLVYKTQ